MHMLMNGLTNVSLSIWMMGPALASTVCIDAENALRTRNIEAKPLFACAESKSRTACVLEAKNSRALIIAKTDSGQPFDVACPSYNREENDIRSFRNTKAQFQMYLVTQSNAVYGILEAIPSLCQIMTYKFPYTARWDFEPFYEQVMSAWSVNEDEIEVIQRNSIFTAHTAGGLFSYPGVRYSEDQYRTDVSVKQDGDSGILNAKLLGHRVVTNAVCKKVD